MKRKFLASWLLRRSLTWLFAAILLVVAGCTKDDDSPKGGADNDDESPSVEWPTKDVVSKTFGHKAVILAGSESVIPFMAKRLKSMESTLVDDVQFVLMDETNAATFLSDESKYSTLRTLWNANRIVGFYNPGANALTLLEKLSRDARHQNEPTNVTSEMIEQYSKISLYLTRADRNSYIYSRPEVDKTIHITTKHTGEDGVVNESEETHTIKPKLSNYEWGRVAESVIEWLNNNVPKSDLHRAFVDTRASNSGISFDPSVATTWDQSITVDYEKYNHDPGRCDDDWPDKRTVTAKVTVFASGAYNEALNADVYDVQVQHYFPTSDVWEGCEHVGSPAAYTNKFAGFTYVGPTFKFSLSSNNTSFKFDGTNVQVIEPAPVVTSGTVTTTHDPGSTTLGGSLSGGGQVDGGTAGVNGGGHFDIGFAADFTLPKDFTAVSHQEMPFTYESKDGYAKWTWGWYDGTDVYELFDFHWGRNADYIAPPDVVCTNYSGRIGLSFGVSNSRNINTTGGDINVYLNMNAPSYKLYSELATTWDFWEDMSVYSDATETSPYQLQMPTVYRYFEKYKPAPAETTNKDGWIQLLAILRTNVNFDAFCDEAIVVGAEYEKDSNGKLGVDIMADEIWKDCINSLITQYNNTSTGDMGDDEWIICLGKTGGTYIPRALHIKGKTWTMVEDYTTIDFPSGNDNANTDTTK